MTLASSAELAPIHRHLRMVSMVVCVLWEVIALLVLLHHCLVNLDFMYHLKDLSLSLTAFRVSLENTALGLKALQLQTTVLLDIIALVVRQQALRILLLSDIIH